MPIINYGIILASGKGSRYEAEVPKQFVKIAGKTILEHTIEVFEKSDCIDKVIIVITPEYRGIAERILHNNSYNKVVNLIDGGETRKESSCIGVNSIKDEEANVIIHDCARPFLSQRVLTDCAKALKTYNAVDVAIPSADTIIEIEQNNIITNIPNRTNLRRGQTPQCFKLSLIKKAHQLAKNDKNFTDDCGLIVKYNLDKVYTVEGELENIKITYPSDIYMADRLFQIRSMLYPKTADIERIKDKILVIFGGTSGIGACIVNLAKKYGARVYPASSSTGCDITNYEQVNNFLENVKRESGRIDYVINTAGVLHIGRLADRDISEIQREISVNYMGSVNVAKASIPYLKESGGGIQLYTSSSYTRGREKYSTYSSAKAGVVNLVQALAEELYSDGVKINAINPERCATPMRFNAFGKEPEDSLLRPEKVAEASIKALLSDLTGQVIDVKLSDNK